MEFGGHNRATDQFSKLLCIQNTKLGAYRVIRKRHDSVPEVLHHNSDGNRSVKILSKTQKYPCRGILIELNLRAKLDSYRVKIVRFFDLDATFDKYQEVRMQSPNSY